MTLALSLSLSLTHTHPPTHTHTHTQVLKSVYERDKREKHTQPTVGKNKYCWTSNTQVASFTCFVLDFDYMRACVHGHTSVAELKGRAAGICYDIIQEIRLD